MLALPLAACASAHTDPAAIEADASVTPMVDAPKQSGNMDAPAEVGCMQTFTGALATWDFTAEPGMQAMTAVKTSAPGIVAGPIERASVLTAVSGLNAINSSNWPLGLLPDPAKHYRVTITPPSGCSLQITAMSIDAKSSATGPAMAILQTSVDGYAQPTVLSTSMLSAPAMSMPAETQMVELRVSGFAASSAAGTMRLQGTFVISGSLL